MLASTTNAVCYGTLSQRSQISRDTTQRFLESLLPNCLRVFDINFRQQFYDLTLVRQSLQFADVLKLSDEELPVLASALGVVWLKYDYQQYDLRLIALTQGEKCHLSLKRPS